MSLTRVHNLSISLDGFATGEPQSADAPFGHAGERLHEWMFATRFWDAGGTAGVDDAFAERHSHGIGAEIMGANKFGPPGWRDDPDWKGWWGPNPPFHTPTFVLTHRPRPSIEMEGGTTFHFLDVAPAQALETARAAADGQDVRIGGGATVVRDFLAAGLVDHMHLVQVPIVLGRGVRIWDGLEALEDDYDIEAVSSPSGVTHLTFTRARLNRGVGATSYRLGMSNDDYPWEPPLAGTDAEQLIGSLDRLRTTFRWKADGLDAAGLRTTIGASTLTLGGLLKHLAAVEDLYSTTKLRGEPIGEPWESAGHDGTNDWEFRTAADDGPEQLYALWDGAVERARERYRAALADGGLDQLVARCHAGGRARQPPATGLRPARGVRPPHRARRPPPRGRRRTRGRGPARGVARVLLTRGQPTPAGSFSRAAATASRSTASSQSWSTIEPDR